MRRPLALIALALAALVAWPAAAPASPKQAVAFEAPRELLSWQQRDRTLDEVRAFGVTQIRQLVFWKQFAPHATSKRRPKFNAADPNAYPAGTWDRLDALIDGAAARGISVHLTLTGPVPKWATSTKRDYVTRPSTKEFPLWTQAGGARDGSRVSTWSIWNEPNQYQFLGPQYVRGKAA